jgi:hypothetical protein
MRIKEKSFSWKVDQRVFTFTFLLLALWCWMIKYLKNFCQFFSCTNNFRISKLKLKYLYYCLTKLKFIGKKYLSFNEWQNFFIVVIERENLTIEVISSIPHFSIIAKFQTVRCTNDESWWVDALKKLRLRWFNFNFDSFISEWVKNLNQIQIINIIIISCRAQIFNWNLNQIKLLTISAVF